MDKSRKKCSLPLVVALALFFSRSAREEEIVGRKQQRMNQSASLYYLIEKNERIRLGGNALLAFPSALALFLHTKQMNTQKGMKRQLRENDKELTRVLVFSYGQNKIGQKEANGLSERGKKTLFCELQRGAPSPPGAGLISCVRSNLPSFSPACLCLLFMV